MAVPNQLRETKPKNRQVAFWVLFQLIALYFAYQVCFRDSAWMGLLPKFAQTSHKASQDFRKLAFVMITCRTVSEILWGIFLCPYSLPLTFSASVVLFNFVVDSLSVIPALRNRDEICFHCDVPVFAVFMFGLLLERFSDYHRACFKAKPENKDKMHVSGPCRYLVHPNYFGYAVARSSFLALGGVWYPQIITVLLLVLFVYDDIAAQKKRNIDKYGEEYKRYWDTTSKLLPGIY